MDCYTNKTIEPDSESEKDEIQKAIKQQEYMQNYFEALDEMYESENQPD